MGIVSTIKKQMQEQIGASSPLLRLERTPLPRPKSFMLVTSKSRREGFVERRVIRDTLVGSEAVTVLPLTGVPKVS